jgi:hypothetical protein
MTGSEHMTDTALSSVAAVAARRVHDLIELSPDDVPHPLTMVGAPPGWRLAHTTGGAAGPARMLVYGPRPDGSWQGCDTIRAFTFTGELPAEVIRANADCTLRSLAGEQITAAALAAPQAATAVRASGYFTAGRRFWAQLSNYVADPTPRRRGLLLEHSVMVDADAAAGLSADIAHLSDAYHHAFLHVADQPSGALGAAKDNEPMTSPQQDAHPSPGFRHFRYDATGLQGKRMRLTDDLPTSDAGDIQDVLIGLTDVICLDDTPSVMHDLRVHPVDQPDTVALVEFTQLALYDDQ